MADNKERRVDRTPSDLDLQVDHSEALKALEYAITSLGDSAAFARDMAERARINEDDDSAVEFDRDAEETLRHMATLSKIAGSLRILQELHKRRGSRAA